MDETTIVLPSARAIRDEQSTIEGCAFLPNYTTMGEFISKLCIVKDYKSMDEDTRVLQLLKAADFSLFSNLKIERNFFTFTKNSNYILSFFQELDAEMYDIKDLKQYDTYSEYEEHITILEELYKRYEHICKEKKLFERVFLSKLYKFNSNYVKEQKKIIIKTDGYLTNFELHLLFECCKYSEVILELSTSKFNEKMREKLAKEGIILEADYIYEISLNTREIITKNKRIQNKNIYFSEFAEDILQVAFVKQKIYEGIQKGYKPQNIAVVLADETLAQKIRDFDTLKNFNFAMGKKFVTSNIYKILDATNQMLDEQTQQNTARIQRVGTQLYDQLYEHYKKPLKEFDLINFLQQWGANFEENDEYQVFTQQLYNFSKVTPYMEDMSIKSILSLFLNRLSTQSIDDVMGGKITVMELLETRLINFDMVVIVGFDEDNVPKKSNKDMFLNTAIRKKANLPTMQERQNLQKHYYDLLISRSKEVYISCVVSPQKSRSVFLKQLGVKNIEQDNDLKYANILFDLPNIQKYTQDKISLPYSFDKRDISNSSLKTFLECKRRYYYKYILKINNHEIPQDIPHEYEIGNHVHLALKKVYENQNSYFDTAQLQKDIYKQLDNLCTPNEMQKYMTAIQKKKLQKFCQNEIDRFNDGWHVYKCEINIKTKINNITLNGYIDRIDKRGDELCVLDYKTGSYKLYNKNNFGDATDFQLEFYHILASTLGNVSDCGFYDLKEGKIVYEPFLKEKLDILQSILKDISNISDVSFDMCEDTKHCLYCEYKTICDRD